MLGRGRLSVAAGTHWLTVCGMQVTRTFDPEQPPCPTPQLLKPGGLSRPRGWQHQHGTQCAAVAVARVARAAVTRRAERVMRCAAMATRVRCSKGGWWATRPPRHASRVAAPTLCVPSTLQHVQLRCSGATHRYTAAARRDTHTHTWGGWARPHGHGGRCAHHLLPPRVAAPTPCTVCRRRCSTCSYAAAVLRTGECLRDSRRGVHGGRHCAHRLRCHLRRARLLRRTAAQPLTSAAGNLLCVVVQTHAHARAHDTRGHALPAVQRSHTACPRPARCKSARPALVRSALCVCVWVLAGRAQRTHSQPEHSDAMCGAGSATLAATRSTGCR